ncbi:hypothetical protein NQ317_003912 [Molorchus minor]|uniref:Uncharacterized protein n=1 Tax=Molorchus minor TaxID=1323400 RepID=A0ABQ9IT15_9CUCU|nr:hypothetical protein NQ317_003912 [Molorchus minor]
MKRISRALREIIVGYGNHRADWSAIIVESLLKNPSMKPILMQQALVTFLAGLKEPLGSTIRAMRPDSLATAIQYIVEENNISPVGNNFQLRTNNQPPRFLTNQQVFGSPKNVWKPGQYKQTQPKPTPMSISTRFTANRPQQSQPGPSTSRNLISEELFNIEHENTPCQPFILPEIQTTKITVNLTKKLKVDDIPLDKLHTLKKMQDAMEPISLQKEDNVLVHFWTAPLYIILFLSVSAYMLYRFKKLKCRQPIRSTQSSTNEGQPHVDEPVRSSHKVLFVPDNTLT